MTKKLSLKIRSEPVILTGPDGKDQHWELREMLASERDSYMDSLGGRMDMEDGKVKKIKSIAGMHSDLLTRTLFLNGIAAKPEQVNGWPASVVSELFKEAQKINGLGGISFDEAKDQAKNA